MKRLSLFVLLLLVCAGMSAASYGILVNGNYYFAGTKNKSPMDPSLEEWQALGVPVEAGDELQLYDRENNAAWAVTLDTWSVAGFSVAGDHYTCTVSGCYDFYIKLKWQADQLYVGPHEGDCSGNKGEYVGECPEVIKHAVTFGVIGENGTLTAATEGSAIASGDEVAEQSEVVFTAAPAEGYELVGWYSEKQGENAIADAGTALTYAATISAATAVYVKFAQIPTQEVSFVNSVDWEAVSCTPTGGTAVAFTASEDVVWVHSAEGPLAACRIWKGKVPQTTTSVVFGNGSESIETTIGEGMFHAQANAWGTPFSVAYGEAVAVSNAGDGVFPNGGQVWSGATIVFTASVPEGKVVEGWYRDETCTERIDEAGTSATYTLTELTEDIAVYVKFGEGEETALEATGAMAEKSRKFVENGQLFIQRGEHVFNALGQIIR